MFKDRLGEERIEGLISESAPAILRRLELLRHLLWVKFNVSWYKWRANPSKAGSWHKSYHFFCGSHMTRAVLFGIMEAYYENKVFCVSQFSRAVNYNRSTVSTFLNEAKSEGFIDKNYRPSQTVIEGFESGNNEVLDGPEFRLLASNSAIKDNILMCKKIYSQFPHLNEEENYIRAAE